MTLFVGVGVVNLVGVAKSPHKFLFAPSARHSIVLVSKSVLSASRRILFRRIYARRREVISVCRPLPFSPRHLSMFMVCASAARIHKWPLQIWEVRLIFKRQSRVIDSNFVGRIFYSRLQKGWRYVWRQRRRQHDNCASELVKCEMTSFPQSFFLYSINCI